MLRLNPSSLRSFTLFELACVVAIILVMTSLIVPALTSLKGAGEVTDAAYTVKGSLEQARTLAMAKNTYVWVGFYEEDPSANGTPASTPPYLGRGRLLIATVYSNDGTEIYSPVTGGMNPLPTSAPSPSASPQAYVIQFGKIIKIDNIHMTDIGSPTPAPNPIPDSLEARSTMPYSSPAPGPFSNGNRLSSDNPESTRFQFSVQGYTFWKTVRFSPRGEARINTSYDYRRIAELGLEPSHGDVRNGHALNAVAIQFSAFGGHFKIYRR